MQSKKYSLLEAIANTATGYAIALIVQYSVFPLFGIHIPASSHIAIASIFTMTSLIRSYVIRRVFNVKDKAVEQDCAGCREARTSTKSNGVDD